MGRGLSGGFNGNLRLAYLGDVDLQILYVAGTFRIFNQQAAAITARDLFGQIWLINGFSFLESMNLYSYYI